LGRRSRKRIGAGRTGTPRSGARRPNRSEAARPARTPAGSPSRSEAKDALAREALEPLGPGERPRAVTVAAVVAFVLALANIALYVAGVEIRGQRPTAGALAYSAVMFVAAWGMWRARYWAVLGMEALLGLVILVFSLVALKAENVLSLLIALAGVGLSGALFWFLIKAMARIQMPARR
jgi:hypothetical protein